MKSFNNPTISENYRGNALAIGNFDGVHKGHQKVLAEAKKKAKKNKIKLAVLTFEPIPYMYLKKIKNHRLSSLKQKFELLKKEKVDYIFIKKFSKNFRNTNYLKFIEKILYKQLKSKFIFVSKNFRFGKNREGNIKKLKFYGDKFGYKVKIILPKKKKKKTISSTQIRNLISNGKIKEANQLLGRAWCIRGKVSKGMQRGRKIGFPTCNLKLNDYIIPKKGVYKVNIISKFFKKKKGIANIGLRPTFNGKKLLLEVNIFGINRNLYKKELNIEFIKFIRPEKKFKNINDLKNQIKKDIQKSK